MTPQLIVLTPVRNEAWILPAFLSATSLWADHIIIADQMSTDGSRDIYKQFPKVHVVDNTLPHMHQAAARRLLFDEARRLLNDDTNAILFALDADEFLAGDFLHSQAWQTLMTSQPNDCFEWRWRNLKADDASLCSLSAPFYWAAHVSDTFFDGFFPDNNIHEWRLPWPPSCNHEIVLDDLFSIHFAALNTMRQINKIRFYQVSSLADTKRYNPLKLYRQYHEPIHPSSIKHNTSAAGAHTYIHTYIHTYGDAYSFYDQNGLDLFALINLSDEGQHYTDDIVRSFAENGIERYALLDIWDTAWCHRNHITPPHLTFSQRAIMRYLRLTNPYSHSLPIRLLDKLLSKLLFR